MGNKLYYQREYVLTEIAQARPNVGLVCYDDVWNYYEIGVCGYLLMYKQRRYKPGGRRCYLINDGLAMCLNFQDYYEMRWFVPTLQYWRKWVSVERLKIALAKFDNKWGDLFNDI